MRKIGLFAALAVVVGSCSIPTDETARAIPQGDLAPSLQQNPTTTTITTVPEIRTRDFAYFLLAEDDETSQRKVQQVVASIPQGSLFDAIDPMDAEGFRDRVGADPGWFNVVFQYDVVGVEVDDGVATVFLQTIGDTPVNTVLRDVAAQLVWTVTGEEGVERMLINIDDAPAELPTTNDAENLTDQPVTIDDYEDYNADAGADDEPDPDQSTTTSTTTTTVPPDDN